MITIDNLTTAYNGLSTDEKPTDARNGDTFYEIDTKKTYAFNKESGQWGVLKTGGSGGGGALVVTETDGDTLNKTWQEIYDAMSAGIPVMIKHGEESNDDEPSEEKSAKGEPARDAESADDIIPVSQVLSVRTYDGEYWVVSFLYHSGYDYMQYCCDSPNDYPILD